MNSEPNMTPHYVRMSYAARLLRVPPAELVKRIESKRIKPAIEIDGAPLYRLHELRNLDAGRAGGATPGG